MRLHPLKPPQPNQTLRGTPSPKKSTEVHPTDGTTPSQPETSLDVSPVHPTTSLTAPLAVGNAPLDALPVVRLVHVLRQGVAQHGALKGQGAMHGMHDENPGCGHGLLRPAVTFFCFRVHRLLFAESSRQS